MEANIITLFRICLVFLAVGLFEIGWVYGNAISTILVVLVLYLDAFDGYVARKFKVASDCGALFDIVGDRIVEAVLWIYFAVIGLISFWIPMVIVTRGLLSDNVRTAAFKEGKTPFGEKTMMKTSITRFLVASRFSRGLYGVMKAVLFVYLGFLIFFAKAISTYSWSISDNTTTILGLISQIIAYLTVLMCILRGLPVLWDGKEILFSKMYPKDITD